MANRGQGLNCGLASRVMIGVGIVFFAIVLVSFARQQQVKELVTVSPLVINAGAIVVNTEQEYLVRVENRTAGMVRLHNMAWW